uniref:Cordon-bleu protein-like 1 n=2 Tax=Echeneis naucrates TaxID=173247 RepID=A0A665WAA5_ECHNA
MDEQENPLERDRSLSVVLPGGLEKNTLVPGSKPVMDLLVTLCATYHLNPSDYTVEVLSPNKNVVSFKPNSPIGSLEAEKIVLKPRGVEEKNRRPYMPEATVRLLINYNKSHKAVVRVSPRVPLELLLPVVCDKCEFKVETTVLLREPQSKEPLDLTKTLNDHGLREVFAKDTAADHRPQSKTPDADLPEKEKEKKNAGLLCLFRRRKKSHETGEATSGPMFPGLDKQEAAGMKLQDVRSSSAQAADVPKKRRAPQPPMGASQSVPANLSSCLLRGPQETSADLTLKTTKKRAPPPPPCVNTHPELLEDTQVKGTADSPITPEELRESDESDSGSLSVSSSSSPHPSQTPSSSSSSRPSFDPYLPSFRGKDLSDARCALAKILTSSISKGTLVRHLRSSATFSKLSSVPFASMTPKSPENRGFCVELESVVKSNLPTDPEWEDPLQKKGMTTFKVIPSKKYTSNDPEPSEDVPDQCWATEEKNPETEASPEEEEDSYPPDGDGAETETPLPCQEIQAPDGPDSPPPPHDRGRSCPESPLSEDRDTDEGQREDEDESEVRSEVAAAGLSGCSDDGQVDSEFLHRPTDVDQCGPDTDHKEVEEEELEEEDSFPPPPPPVFFSEDVEVREEAQEDGNTSSLPASEPVSPACNGFGHQDESASAAPAPRDKTSIGPSRFAQAVALAVQRSRLRSQKALGPQSPGDPHNTLPSPPRSTYQYGA